jgi:hypothetical protein
MSPPATSRRTLVPQGRNIRQPRAGAFPPSGTQRAARPVSTSTEDGETVESEVTDDNDMSLLLSISGHTTSVRDAVKKSLFKVCKFITSNDDLDYSSSSGICALMLQKCTITTNSRRWWNYVKPIVKRTLADHRNNRIKTLQQYYFGKFRICAVVIAMHHQHLP